MPLERLRVSEGFARTAKHLDARDRARAWATVEALGEEHPDLPGPMDERVDAPPTGSYWARRIPGTSFRVLYSVTAEAVVIRSVNRL